LQVEDLEKLDFVQHKKKLAKEKVVQTVRTSNYVVPVKKYSITGSELKSLSNGVKQSINKDSKLLQSPG